MTTSESPATRRQHDRRQMAWASAAVIFGGAPHLFTVVPWVSLLVLAIAGWRIAAAARGWPLPSLWIRAPATFFGFFAVALTYRSISGVEAGSALLLVMAGLKLLETRTERDRVLVVMISYFLLFTVFLREQAIWSMAWLAIGVFGLTLALAQTIRRDQLLTLPVGAGLAGRLILQALPIALILFVLFPRLPGPFWSLPSGQQSARSGLSDEIRPGDISDLSLSDEVAFRVRFEGTPPRPEELYWRGPVLERFDGRGWSARRQERRPVPAEEVRRTGAAVGYQVVLEPNGQRWLMALETPVSWTVARAQLSATRQLLSAETLYERISYNVRSVLSSRGAGFTPSPRLAENLRLPEGSNPRTIALAERLRQAASDDRDFVRRTLQLLGSGDYFYSLSPPPLGDNSVDELLFMTREGFCEHYASALAVLARAGGIPARVVAGYQGSERNPFGDYWIVRQANAHAWTELWLDGAWERVDPTTIVAPARIERGFDDLAGNAAVVSGRLWRSNALAYRVVLSWDAVNAAWDRWVLAYGPETQEDLLLALGFDVPRPIQLAALASAATVVCLFLLAALVRRGGRVPRDRVANLYDTLCSRLAGVVRPRGSSETAASYAAAVAAARPDLAAEVQTLTTQYLRLRYGGPAPPQQLADFAGRVRRFRPVASRAG